MEKTCSKCSVLKVLEEFAKQQRGKFGRKSYCKACEAAWQKIYQRDYSGRNPEKRWANYLFRYYRLTVEQYYQMLASQNGVCKICAHSSEERLQVDHDHRCCPGAKSCGKCVRGLLCSICNTVLGFVDDSPTILLAALRYVNDVTRTRQ